MKLAHKEVDSLDSRQTRSGDAGMRDAARHGEITLQPASLYLDQLARRVPAGTYTTFGTGCGPTLRAATRFTRFAVVPLATRRTICAVSQVVR